MKRPDPRTAEEARQFFALKPWPTTGRLLNLGKNATYAAIQRGEIPSCRIGGRIVVPVEALLRVLAGEKP